jgi:hypothetical protein
MFAFHFGEDRAISAGFNAHFFIDINGKGELTGLLHLATHGMLWRDSGKAI